MTSLLSHFYASYNIKNAMADLVLSVESTHKQTLKVDT